MFQRKKKLKTQFIVWAKSFAWSYCAYATLLGRLPWQVRLSPIQIESKHKLPCYTEASYVRYFRLHTDCWLTIFVFLFIHLAQLKRCSSLLILKGVKGWVADVLGAIHLAKWAPRSSPPLGKRCSCEEEECGWVGRVVVPSNSHARGLPTRAKQEEHIITT